MTAKITPGHWVDIDPSEDPEDEAYCAFCSCGWKGEWHHVDTEGYDAEEVAHWEANYHLGEQVGEPDRWYAE